MSRHRFIHRVHPTRSPISNTARVLGTLAGLTLVMATDSTAQRSVVAPLGSEFQVNSYTTGIQQSPAVAHLPTGGFVAAWSSPQDGSYSGVIARRFSAAGIPLGTEIQVNTYTTGSQRQPAVAADASGNFVVVWYSETQASPYGGVFARRFNNGGGALGGELQISTDTMVGGSAPAVARADSGDFVVTWQSYGPDGNNFGVFGRRFSGAGSPIASEFQVNTYTTGSQRRARVASDPAGNFLVVWDGPTDGLAGEHIVARRFDSLGMALGSEFRVSTTTSSIQNTPAATLAPNGNAVITWQGFDQDGDDNGIAAQRLDAMGNLAGGEFVVNSYSTSFQRRPAVANDHVGNFVITWSSYLQDGSFDGVFAQRFDHSGTPSGSEYAVNAYTTANQTTPAIASDPVGNTWIVWESLNQDGAQLGIFGQLYGDLLLVDGFESGDLSGWTAASP